jgi:hypothetical protein
MNRSAISAPAVRAVCGAGLSAFLIAWASVAWSWQTAHGKPDNSGFADVQTAPASTPLPNPPLLGGLAPGAGPVIAPDGTVYVVNGRGKIMSFRPDGTPGWTRDIGGFQHAVASPALGNDGSVYLIGVATIRDKTTNPPTTRKVAELHKFTSTGGMIWRVPLPGSAAGFSTSAPPNIWRVGDADVIMVPAIIKRGSGFAVRLTAFSSQSGAILADQVVKEHWPDIVAGAGWKWYDVFDFLNLCTWIDICGFTPPSPAGNEHTLPNRMLAPFPAVAVYNPTTNNVPLVFVSDGVQDLVGYFFNGDSFLERFRVRDDKQYLLSTPLAWPDGHAMISTGGDGVPSEVMFAGLQMTTIRSPGPISIAAPTALGNSRFALVHRFGGVTILRGAYAETSVTLPGESIASAAASRGHLFVSTASALHTFDKTTMQELARFDWRRGGVSPVAIGPQGHVYAIANDRLHVFPPQVGVAAAGQSTGTTTSGGVFQDAGTPAKPPSKPVGGIFQDAGVPAPAGQTGGVFQDAGVPAPAPAPATPQSKSYKPPLTTAGNRLFACEKLDGDDCGKGDHRTIAAAFCAKSGYAQAPQFKVDNKKTKAETLDGRYCSKKKCKVFDEIVCVM